MFPLFPFVTGLLTGAVAIKMIRSDKAKKQLDKAQDRLREATVSSLNTIEQSTARLRDRLQEAPTATKTIVEPTVKPATKPTRKPATKRNSPAKPKVSATKAGGSA